MKPFNLEEAKAGKLIQTREGVLVEFGAYLPKATKSGRVVVVLPSGEVRTYREDGTYFGPDNPDPSDLFMVSEERPDAEKRTVWVNLYEFGTCFWYDTEAAADKAAPPFRIGNKAYPFEIEE